MEENNLTLSTEQAQGPAKTFTQEEVNNLIKDRLDRAEKKWQEKYSNYYSADDFTSKTEELNKQIAELGNSLNVANDKATADAQTLADKEQAIADLEAKLKRNETDSAKTRIALECGIPYELADRLTGDTVEEIMADAQRLAPMLATRSSMPLRNPEATSETDGVMKAFRELNPNLKF